jgi:molecular chaperone GrpE
MADESRIEEPVEPEAKPNVRDSGPVEGVRGSREVAPAELDEVVRQRDEYLDALQRSQAEFANYRKRMARDQASLVARAAERLVKELLPVLDDLERALEAANEHEEAKLEEGVRLVQRSLAAALAKEGLQEIATDGSFDPHTQEALLSQPSDEEEGTVIQVVQKGYRLGDRVLRPARVVVAAAQPAAQRPVRESGPAEGVPGEPGGSPGADATPVESAPAEPGGSAGDAE